MSEVKHETKGTVLIVEDDRAIIELMSELIVEEGYRALLANNGDEALDLLTSATKLPDVVLLDLMMPIKDGYEFRREQLANPRLAKIPIVVMSADAQLERRKAELQANAYLKKPLNVEDLLELLKRYTGGQNPPPTEPSEFIGLSGN